MNHAESYRKGGFLGPGKVAEPHSAFNNPSSAEMVPKWLAERLLLGDSRSTLEAGM
jgi:hypothetical protein